MRWLDLLSITGSSTCVLALLEQLRPLDIPLEELVTLHEEMLQYGK